MSLSILWGHCITSREIAGSIPGGVIENVHWHNPSGRTVALESTQPLREMSTMNTSWGKGVQYLGLTTFQPSCAVLKSGSFNLLVTSGPVICLYRDCFAST